MSIVSAEMILRIEHNTETAMHLTRESRNAKHTIDKKPFKMAVTLQPAWEEPEYRHRSSCIIQEQKNLASTNDYSTAPPNVGHKTKHKRKVSTRRKKLCVITGGKALLRVVFYAVSGGNRRRCTWPGWITNFWLDRPTPIFKHVTILAAQPS